MVWTIAHGLMHAGSRDLLDHYVHMGGWEEGVGHGYMVYGVYDDVARRLRFRSDPELLRAETELSPYTDYLVLFDRFLTSAGVAVTPELWRELYESPLDDRPRVLRDYLRRHGVAEADADAVVEDLMAYIQSTDGRLFPE